MISFYSRIFKHTNWNRVYDRSRYQALKAFHHVYRTQKWYQHLCKTRGIEKKRVRTSGDFFQSVPILDKKSVFQDHSLEELLGKHMRKTRMIFPSSGRTGLLSYGVMSAADLNRATKTTDFFLRLFFGFEKRDTLIINCSAMGVRVFTRFTCCDVGSRPDLVAGLLKNLSGRYKNFVITTYPNFLKHLVEYCLKVGVVFKALNVFFFTGGDYFPESLRAYIHQITQKSFEQKQKGCWLGIYGLTEIGYPVFFETPATAVLRQFIQTQQLKETDFGDEHPFIVAKPFYFNYVPLHVYVENIPVGEWNELAFTHLVKKQNQLVRYNSGDGGKLFDTDTQIWLQREFNKVSREYGFLILSLFGKSNDYITVNDKKIFFADIKEILFQNSGVAAGVTGYFTVTRQKGKCRLAVQLAKNKTMDKGCVDKMQKTLNELYPDIVNVEFVAYQNMVYQMGLDFERKFDHCPF